MAQGAGILPYAIINEGGATKVYFLFHTTLQGKKVGSLIDFGGHKEENEHAILAAAREFSEETCGLFYLATKNNPSQLTELISEIMKTVKDEYEQQKLQIVKDATLWMKNRLESGNRTWHTECLADWGRYDLFITPVDWVDASILGTAFESKNSSSTFIKKRKFLWIDAICILEGKTELPVFDRIKDSKDFLKIVAQVLQQ